MTAKKDCELCGNPARMFCESDQASLCWSCDEEVHGANFLVAKHSRTLLCHTCHLPTPWKAAGAKLGPTASVCRACAVGEADSAHSDNNNDGGEEDYDTTDTIDYSEEEEEVEEEEEDGENQVVPWTAAAEETSSKRSREACFESEEKEEEEEGWCSGSETNCGDLRPLKACRRMSEDDGGTAAIVEKLRRFQQGMAAAAEDGGILGLCKLTRY